MSCLKFLLPVLCVVGAQGSAIVDLTDKPKSIHFQSRLNQKRATRLVVSVVSGIIIIKTSKGITEEDTVRG